MKKLASGVVVLGLTMGACATATSTGPEATTTTTVTTQSIPTETETYRVNEPDGIADQILTGGLIVTMDQPAEAEALALDGNLILAVGDEADILAMAGPETTVVDLDGRVVFPGFIDAHSHWYQPGRIGDYGPEQVNQVLLSRGWTGTNELNIEPFYVEQFFAWHEAGRIDLRMNGYVSINTPGTDQDRHGDWFRAYGLEPGSVIGDRLRIPGVKIFVASDWDRVFKWSEEELVDLIGRLHGEGWQVSTKQISDDVLDMTLTAFESLDGSGQDRRHRLEHALEMRVDQIPRVAAAELVPIVQLGGIESDLQLEEGFEAMVADDGRGAAWPFRDMLAAGLPVVGSMAVAPLEGVRSPFTISVMQMIHGAITGVSEVGNEPWPNRKAQLMTVDEALQSITVQAAWSTFEEDSRGSLKAGKLADLVVLSADLRAAREDPALLRDIRVAATFVDGELLWCGFGLDEWCSGFGQAIPERLLDETTLAPLQEGDLAGEDPPPTILTGGPATASSFAPEYPPGNAFDGATDLGGWVAAAPPPGWIEIDLGSDTAVTRVNLWVDQDPAVFSRHRILGGAEPAPTELLGTLESETTWGQVLSIEGDWMIRYLRVETLESTPTYGWLEIEVVTAP